MTDRFGLILLTGPPGIGKTTLVRKVCEDLSTHKIVCNGFYTEEVRNESKVRIGFDVVTLNDKRGILARENCTGKGPFVGKYCVQVKDFEDIAVPLINPSTRQREVLVIDEVGKMELKSKRFEIYVQNCIMKTILLATVPHDSRRSLHLVDKLKNHPKAHLLVVTKENRNHLQHEITERILKLVCP